MTDNTIHIRKGMLPFAWLYRIGVYIRDVFFRAGIFKQKTYDLPIICVGNLAVGGTGKTPHIEYLIRLLSDNYRVAVLSRGYKRKTKGFVLADESSTSKDIGDEPYQMKCKYPNVLVAVDAKRSRGIETLLDLPENEKPQVILLDDAYQHRYVKPSLLILLTDYNRPYFEDAIMPMGKLREPASKATLANFIVATKCPKDIKPIDMRIFTHGVNPYPYQSLMFTSVAYRELTPVFEGKEKLQLTDLKDKDVLLLAGIASPKLLLDELDGKVNSLTSLIYSDHHNFSKKNIREICNAFENMDATKSIIVTTEKDAARLKSVSGLSDEVKNAIYSLPIEISFVNEESNKLFNKKIIEHVRENSRNSSLHKK